MMSANDRLKPQRKQMLVCNYQSVLRFKAAFSASKITPKEAVVNPLIILIPLIIIYTF